MARVLRFWSVPTLLLSACASVPGQPDGQDALPVAVAMARVLESTRADSLPPTTADTQPAPAIGSEGRRVFLEVEAVPARLLFAALAELGGTDIVAEQKLTGPVSLRLADQPWFKAVRLASASLGWQARQRGGDGPVLITAGPCQPNLCPPRQVALHLKHRQADGLIAALKQVKTASGGLNLAADKVSNSLVLSGSDEELAAATALVRDLDRRQAVVLVEAWVLEISDDRGHQLGLELGLTRRDLAGGLSGQEHNNLLAGSLAQPAAAVLLRSDRDGLAIRLASLARRGYTRILSNPRIWVVAGEQAEIFQGDEVPYSVRTDEGTSHTQFRQAGLGLKVRPRVKGTGHIELDLQISKDTVDRSRENPPISRREMRTRLVIEPGQAAMIGGISSSGESGRRRGVPGLGAVGGLGEQGRDSAQLLVVISARVPEQLEALP